MPARNSRGSARLDTGLMLACCVLAVIAMLLPESVDAPVSAAIRRTVLSPLVAVQSQAQTLRGALTARDQELAVRGNAAARAISAPALEQENAALRAMLGLAGRLRSGFVPAEAFHPAGLTDDFTLTISAGSDVGVQPFAPVVTADGLVGMVEQVDPTSSIAITWAHPSFAVSAVSEDESAFGIVKPHLVTGPERYLLEMTGVPFRASLDSGALIVSSGLGPTYPRGIAIGTVISEVPTAERWARTYLLKPSVLPGTLSAVVVLRPERVASGVAGVWMSFASADSAAQAIVAASDSAAREAALAELRARRAVLDSAAADSARADSLLAPLGPAPGVRAPAITPVVPPRVPPRIPPGANGQSAGATRESEARASGAVVPPAGSRP